MTEGQPEQPAPTPEPESLGAAVRRLARAATDVAEAGAAAAVEAARHAAEAARPEAERLAKQARVAADAARPQIERAAQDAARFVREHEDDFRRAAKRSAGLYVRTATPRFLRPAVDALDLELHRPGEAPGATQPEQPSAEPEPGAEQPEREQDGEGRA